MATGTGNTALALAPFVQDVTGVDVADAMLAHARERATRERLNNATFRSGDAEALPFPDGTFTLVTSRHAPTTSCTWITSWPKRGGYCGPAGGW